MRITSSSAEHCAPRTKQPQRAFADGWETRFPAQRSAASFCFDLATKRAVISEASAGHLAPAEPRGVRGGVLKRD